MKKRGARPLWKKIFFFGFKVFFAIFCFTLIQVVAFKYLNPPFTVNMVYEWAISKIEKKTYAFPRYEWQDINDISPHLRKAVIASEDQRFLSHHGFDLEELKIVFEELLIKHRIRGASTISMQAARSLFLFSSRNITRKLAEAYYTVLIELIWDKKRIFEIYLNTVDWGTGVVGAEAAAQKYYSIHAIKIDPSQASLLAAILPSPHKWSVKNPTPYLKTRQKRILKDMPKMPLL